jgi:hypothetical protein
MTSGRYFTSHPFTITICMRCSAERHTDVLQMLRPSIRRCPHGILVTTECLLGQLTCATRPPHDGVILMLQPCSTARIPTAPAQWLGPITNTAQARAARDWIEQGNWDRHAPPAHLRAEANLSRPSIRN